MAKSHYLKYFGNIVLSNACFRNIKLQFYLTRLGFAPLINKTTIVNYSSFYNISKTASTMVKIQDINILDTRNLNLWQ